MSQRKVPVSDRQKRHRTRYRGITFREKADGSRTYFVYAQGLQHPVDGGEQEAVAKQAELRGRVARGERVASSNIRFREMAQLWFASKRKLRPWTLKGYEDVLNRVLIPRFGNMKVDEISVEHVASLIRDLENQ